MKNFLKSNNNFYILNRVILRTNFNESTLITTFCTILQTDDTNSNNTNKTKSRKLKFSLKMYIATIINNILEWMIKVAKLVAKQYFASKFYANYTLDNSNMKFFRTYSMSYGFLYFAIHIWEKYFWLFSIIYKILPLLS